ncbi:MAG: hypothetical protein WBD09_10655 [Halobacteriota archaeon]
MEKNTRNRVALLGALLVTGLVLAGMGTAFGAGAVFQGKAKVFGAMVITDQVTISEDGKVIQNFTLPEGEWEEYTWETSDGAIHIFKMTEEEMEKRQAELEAELNKWLEIAKNDGRVQELIEGKEYNVLGTGTGFRDEKKIDTTFLMLDVEGKYYVVTIDMNSETVKSVEEQQIPAGYFITTGPDGETTWSEGVAERIHRPPIPKR